MRETTGGTALEGDTFNPWPATLLFVSGIVLARNCIRNEVLLVVPLEGLAVGVSCCGG